jgi:hypothetical protein
MERSVTALLFSVQQSLSIEGIAIVVKIIGFIFKEE